VQVHETIKVDVRGEVHWLTLNRPGALNAINTLMVAELRAYFDSLYQDPSCRVVVMRGAGRAFCAGLDIKAAKEKDAGQVPFAGGFNFQGYLTDVYVAMRRCPQPIISLIQGPACGGGFAFALASDIRIAGETARSRHGTRQSALSYGAMGAG